MSKSLDPKMKQALQYIMHGRKGVALKFDNHLLSLDLSETAKLLYAGLFFLIPQTVRKRSFKYKEMLKNTRAKTEIYSTLNISRAQFYRSINELESIKLITTHRNKNGVTFYELHHNLDNQQPGTYPSFITTDILQNKYVTTKQNKQKTYSANARIVLGRLSNLSKTKLNRTVEATAKGLSSILDIKKSTIYYLLKQFDLNGNLEANKENGSLYTLVLLDHYISEQRNHNEQVIKLKNERLKVMHLEPSRATMSAIDIIYNSMK